MNTPTIKEVRRAYKETDATGKLLLENLFGRISFDIRDRVKDFEDACYELGTTSTRVVTAYPAAEMAYGKLRTAVDALNEGWKPDWSNEDEYKYLPWFGFRGGRFVFNLVDYGCTCSYLGSRLCFRTRELAEYAGKQFEDIYNEFLAIS